jgi:carbon-monoxide dehydrogenase large subunit
LATRRPDAVFANADVTIKEMLVLSPHPSVPLETCGCVASFDKVKGELTLYGTFQAPHVIRTVVSLILRPSRAQDPCHRARYRRRLRQQGRRLSRLCLLGRRLHRSGRSGQMGRGPDGKPLHYAFARDYHMTTELAATKDGKITGMRVHVLADHGAFDACADPSKWPAGFMNICTGSYDIPTAHLAVDGVYTNKARVGSPIAARSASPKRCLRSNGCRTPRRQAWHGRGRAAHQELHQARAVPLQVGARLGV